ncbi:MAG: hypothetical protein IAG13_13205 [Deltaproteobacteria bacterium]|nr:hypothetical protein [Nannocystaceae bacterium]
MLRSLALFALVFVAACRPEPTHPTPAPTPTPVDSADGGEPQAPPNAETCGEAGTCTDGKQCIEYFGIAGPRGPKFYACEIPCADAKNTCPIGQECITIADGPGQVCRPPSEPSVPPAK